MPGSLPLPSPAAPGRREESGFTLIELVAAVSVMAIGIFGLIGTFGSATDVASTTSNRSRAVAIATREIEDYRAMKYEDMAVSSTTTTSTVMMGGREYRIEKGVSWTSGLTPSGLVAEGYKRATVSVTWTDRSGPHTIHQTTFVYPGGYGPANEVVPPPPSSGGTPAAPLALVATLPTVVTGTTAVDLSWTPPASSSPPVSAFDIIYSTDGWATFHQIASATTGTNFRVDNLSAGTTYQFKVRSRSAEGSVSAWFPAASSTPITTSASASTTCSAGAFTITPSAIRKKSGSEGSRLVSNPMVSVNTTGSGCVGLFMTYKPTDAQSDSVLLSKSTSGGTWTGAIRGTSFSWDVGVKTVDVFTQAGTKIATSQLTVCDNNAKTCP